MFAPSTWATDRANSTRTASSSAFVELSSAVALASKLRVSASVATVADVSVVAVSNAPCEEAISALAVSNWPWTVSSSNASCLPLPWCSALSVRTLSKACVSLPVRADASEILASRTAAVTICAWSSRSVVRNSSVNRACAFPRSAASAFNTSVSDFNLLFTCSALANSFACFVACSSNLDVFSVAMCANCFRNALLISSACISCAC